MRGRFCGRQFRLVFQKHSTNQGVIQMKTFTLTHSSGLFFIFNPLELTYTMSDSKGDTHTFQMSSIEHLRIQYRNCIAAGYRK